MLGDGHNSIPDNERSPPQNIVKNKQTTFQIQIIENANIKFGQK